MILLFYWSLVVKTIKKYVILSSDILNICPLTYVFCFTGTTATPTLFPLVQCNPVSGDKIAIGCLASDFYPKSLTFKWTENSGTSPTSVQYPPAQRNNGRYMGVSLVQVTKSDWNSGTSFNCSVDHGGITQSVKITGKWIINSLLSLHASTSSSLFSLKHGNNICFSSAPLCVFYYRFFSWKYQKKNIV